MYVQCGKTRNSLPCKFFSVKSIYSKTLSLRNFCEKTWQQNPEISTVWKFESFSATKILREIICGNFWHKIWFDRKLLEFPYLICFLSFKSRVFRDEKLDREIAQVEAEVKIIQAQNLLEKKQHSKWINSVSTRNATKRNWQP